MKKYMYYALMFCIPAFGIVACGGKDKEADKTEQEKAAEDEISDEEFEKEMEELDEDVDALESGTKGAPMK